MSVHRVLVVLLILALNATAGPASPQIDVLLSSGTSDSPLSGRLFVMLSNDPEKLPMEARRPSDTNPWFAIDVEDWRPGSVVSLPLDAVGYPFRPDELPTGRYAFQAVLDTNTTARDVATAPGNLFGAPVVADAGELVSLALTTTVEEVVIRETIGLRDLRVPSALLSEFHGRPVDVMAAVFLPPSYHAAPERHYPVVFLLPGFGSPHVSVFSDDFQHDRFGVDLPGPERIFVLLDQECPLGYHGFADSAVNGPWARAFREEFLPRLGDEYRVIRDPGARFLVGHSSGAWAGLWLQMRYPHEFAGVWAISPDPVDFRSFADVDIYRENANLYRSTDGTDIARNRDLAAIDRVFGSGWALGTFEAVFSPIGERGGPRQLWDRRTGAIDPSVAEAWRRYDLRILLESDQVLRKALAGKVRITVAMDDPFGLGRSVERLRDAMAEVGFQAEIEILPTGGHDLWTDELRERIRAWIDETLDAG